jgi:hypothetical protein
VPLSNLELLNVISKSSNNDRVRIEVIKSPPTLFNCLENLEK